MSQYPVTLIDQLDALLPQTQCQQCGYGGCRPYAEALVMGEADINQCPPGGEAGIQRLANALHRAVRPLNPHYGQVKPLMVARIDEGVCIGCTLCIQACPVDAIVGAAKWMHTVIADEFTGCALCLPPCPVDCITLIPPKAEGQGYAQRVDQGEVERQAATAHARRRYQARLARQERQGHERLARLASKARSKWSMAGDGKEATPRPSTDAPVHAVSTDEQTRIQAALARAAATFPSAEN